MKYKSFKYNNLKIALDLIDEFSKTITVSYKNIQPCVFNIISDTYYRENYHSDILSYYFHFPAAKRRLISWINKKLSNSNIQYSDYDNSELPEREAQRRDITIYSNDRTHAIVIENKSNDASDRPRQLIGYYSDLIDQGIKVDAIIYLNKYSIKEPDYSGWKKDEIKTIKKLLLPTQLTGPGSITENVINKIIDNEEDPQLIGLSKELQSLFNNIINGEKIMSNEDLSKFLKVLNTKKTAENFKKLVDAYNSLPSLMRDYYKEFLEEKKEKLPKIKKIARYKDNCLYIDFECDVEKKNKQICTKTFYIDFWFSHEEIQIILGSRDYVNWNKDLKALKKRMKNDWSFGDIPKDDNPTISFSEVYDEEAVKEKMKEVINSFRKYIV